MNFPNSEKPLILINLYLSINKIIIGCPNTFIIWRFHCIIYGAGHHIYHNVLHDSKYANNYRNVSRYAHQCKIPNSPHTHVLCFSERSTKSTDSDGYGGAKL